jgi:hypothetical protein
MVDAIAYTKICNLVMSQSTTLEGRLASVFKAHRDGSIPSSVKIDQVHAFNGLSGYNYWAGDDLIGQLYMGTLISGTYVIYKKTFINSELKEVYDYYDMNGKLFYNSETLDGQCLTYNSIAMDPSDPFINHLYNVLSVEYDGMNYNLGNTGRIVYIEKLLNEVYKDPDMKISANDKLKDTALLKIKEEILTIEKDPILTWNERQEVFKQLRSVRSKILSTKRRVHKFSIFLYDFIVYLSNFSLKMKRYKMRPVSNILGTLYNNTIGKILWFIGTVRSNIGISVAMAIYGPFTFYFITQPLNPHAMWMVGKVRNAYIQTANYMDTSSPNESKLYVSGANDDVEIEVQVGQDVPDEIVDSVTTKQSAIKNFAETPARGQKWDDRMSSFKAMQIAYEGEMIFSARMGRIEQFETQFNFPLTAEAAWMEMELYSKSIDNALKYNKNLDGRYIQFLKNEQERTTELQLYVWQKVAQFFMDHPYIVVDEEKEQVERNYYLGRQFIFFEKMTKKLQKIGMAQSPITHKNISALAKRFTKIKRDGTSVLDTLKKNSKLFQQKNFLSSDEHRDYMARQWEVLFLQQNKKQEAASFALQAYTWSIKNALWLVQTIYSAKRNEIAPMTYKYNLDNLGTQDVIADEETNEYIGNMFHNLAMEFVSIKKEMKNNLPNDKEVLMRENVINNIKQYIIERDKLFNTGVFAATEEKANKKTI